MPYHPAQASAMTILGIDPGSRITGYGLIRSSRQHLHFLACGCIKTAGDSFPMRLKTIFDALQAQLQDWPVDEMAIEKVFMSKNADAALKLGQARGAAITAVITRGIAVYEYTANQVKQAVVGKGHADKTQVQHMVKVLLNYSPPLQADAADALAIAICHANHRYATIP